MRFLVICAFLAASVTASAADDGGLDRLVRQFCALEACGSANDSGGGEKVQASAASLVRTLREDGTWPDVDYVTNERGFCPKIEALARMRVLAIAGEAAAYRRALGWWLRNRPSNSNWWWNEIGFPQALGESAVMMRDALNADERKGICEILRLSDASRQRTGQNHVWLERVKLMRAMVENDPALAREAVDAIAGEIVMSDLEGIRSDWCFHQHGRQPQFGNYGLSFVCIITRLAAELDGTPFAFAPEKRALLKGLLENGYRWIVWKGRMDVSAMGRQLTPNAQVNKGRAVRATFAEYARIDPTFPQDLPTGFRFFDQSAYGVYRTKDWMASVRMATTTVAGAETRINSENILGGNQCDGALLTYVTGDEYKNLSPLWGRFGRLVPGITGYADVSPYDPKSSGGRIQNGSDAVTGEGSGNRGVIRMELKKEGLRALKSWSFDTAGVTCEGREIASTDPREVITVVEQAWAAKNAKILPFDGRYVRAINGTVGYVIAAKPEDIRFSVAEQKADFTRTHPKQPSHPIAGRVFSLLISHGARPTAASYRYRVVPGSTEADLMKEEL